MKSIPVIPGKTQFYKYRSLATVEHAGFAKDILLNHRLYCTAPAAFNDPFDCVPRYSFDATDSEKLARAVARIQFEDPTVSKEEAIAKAPTRYQWVESNGLERFRTMIRDVVGIVSLSRVRDNPLLWAHYASAHTGISIEFTASEVAHLDFFGHVLPVRYREDRPVIEFYRDPPREQVEKAVLTKSTHWKYERESRILTYNRDEERYFHFPPEVISAVYLGCRVSAGHRSQVAGWLRDRDCTSSATLYRARPSEASYGLEFDIVA